jgi:hypothetical protein
VETVYVIKDEGERDENQNEGKGGSHMEFGEK